jgi:hypothetical protein
MKTSAPVLILMLLAMPVFGAVSAFGGSVEDHADGSTVWQAGVDNVEIEWNSDGSVKRISSRYNTPVEFGDRRGISKAQIIAEEKAKAAIIRFLNQTVSSTRVVTEVQHDLYRTTQERESGKKPSVQKQDQRTMMEALTEVTASFASGHLKGVIVLEKGYSDKTDEAWVVVGISDKTIRATRDVTGMGQERPARRVGPDELPDGVGRQPSEERRTRQRDW